MESGRRVEDAVREGAVIWRPDQNNGERIALDDQSEGRSRSLRPAARLLLLCGGGPGSGGLLIGRGARNEQRQQTSPAGIELTVFSKTVGRDQRIR